jgi:hypothetical protein
MGDKTRPLTPSEKDYEKKLREDALKEMRDQKMLEESGSAYDKARQQSLGAPDKAPVKKRAGGMCTGYAKGGSVKSSASKRADGCAQRGKTKGRMV